MIGLLADGADKGKAAPLALLVIVVLAIACYLLFKSMSRHLRKVRDEWPEDQDAPAESTTERTDQADPS